ncbi:hypothetical protein SADUNF_Sadunf06G0109200 [Salix dunnii]|uniref:Uncharacterized protein n=1 Tax=Salix dunnii TaxID=1413687 RepID=A0A835K3Q3_9ROSI|nr:hypothetical protein SADUNF_Sadunf06G0109200 [Salix dunnii]
MKTFCLRLVFGLLDYQDLVGQKTAAIGHWVQRLPQAELSGDGTIMRGSVLPSEYDNRGPNREVGWLMLFWDMTSSVFPGELAGRIFVLSCRMNIQVSSSISTITRTQQKAASSSSSRKPPFFSSGKSQEPRQDGDANALSFRKGGGGDILPQFSPKKYVTWNPSRSNYPLSEEVDPIKRTERSDLRLWTSPEFTLAGAIIILLVYTFLAQAK